MVVYVKGVMMAEGDVDASLYIAMLHHHQHTLARPCASSLSLRRYLRTTNSLPLPSRALVPPPPHLVFVTAYGPRSLCLLAMQLFLTMQLFLALFPALRVGIPPSPPNTKPHQRVAPRNYTHGMTIRPTGRRGGGSTRDLGGGGHTP